MKTKTWSTSFGTSGRSSDEGLECTWTSWAIWEGSKGTVTAVSASGLRIHSGSVNNTFHFANKDEKGSLENMIQKSGTHCSVCFTEKETDTWTIHVFQVWSIPFRAWVAKRRHHTFAKQCVETRNPPWKTENWMRRCTEYTMKLEFILITRITGLPRMTSYCVVIPKTQQHATEARSQSHGLEAIEIHGWKKGNHKSKINPVWPSRTSKMTVTLEEVVLGRCAWHSIYPRSGWGTVLSRSGKICCPRNSTWGIGTALCTWKISVCLWQRNGSQIL